MIPNGSPYLTVLLAHLKQVVNQIPSAVYVCEAPSGVIRLYNQRAAELWGRHPTVGDTDELFCGGYRLFLTDGRALPHAETPMAQSLRDGTTHDEEVVIERPEGSRVTVRVNIGPLRDPDAFQDITSLKQLEREQRARADAEAINQAKDEFLAMLGHELRNPLDVIGNAVRVLNTAGSQEDAARRAREAIGHQAGRLGRLVDDLLDIARVATGKVSLVCTPVDLAETVGRCVQGIEASDPSRQHKVTVRAEPIWIDADPIRVEQIVTNLLSNAVKYTPAGGHIDITVTGDGRTARLAVRDTGVGMKPAMIEQIFELFFQGERALDRSEGGLGIGLTLVRRLAEMHGGLVEAESPGPGLGSTVTVELPQIVAPAELARPLEPAPSASPRRILIVEDSRDSRDMLRFLLEHAGHEVYEAEDGRAGLEAILKLRPDVALLDVGLPGLDGYEIARRVRGVEAGRSVCLVALTGYGRPEDQRRSQEAGFDAHLVKPVDPARLAVAISAARSRQR
jgi:signal transduction histidine kinase/ActR/RegA family two-component response regulator